MCTSILQHFCDVLMFLKQEIRPHANTIILTSSYIIAKSAIFVRYSFRSFFCFFFGVFYFFSFGHGLQSSWHQPVLSWNTGGSAFITIYSVYDANICSNKPITFLKLC